VKLSGDRVSRNRTLVLASDNDFGDAVLLPEEVSDFVEKDVRVGFRVIEQSDRRPLERIESFGDSTTRRLDCASGIEDDRGLGPSLILSCELIAVVTLLGMYKYVVRVRPRPLGSTTYSPKTRSESERDTSLSATTGVCEGREPRTSTSTT